MTVSPKVFRVTCPLGPEGTARLLQRLRGGPGDVTSSRDKKKKGKRGGSLECGLALAVWVWDC